MSVRRWYGSMQTQTLYRFAVGLTTNAGSPVDAREVRAFFAARIAGLRTFEADGFWMSNPERALIVETVDVDGKGRAFFTDIAREAARVFSQDAVLLEAYEMRASFITSGDA